MHRDRDAAFGVVGEVHSEFSLEVCLVLGVGFAGMQSLANLAPENPLATQLEAIIRRLDLLTPLAIRPISQDAGELFNSSTTWRATVGLHHRN